MANVVGPRRSANHSGVVVSWLASWRPCLRNAATSSSLPGFASRRTKRLTVSISISFEPRNGPLRAEVQSQSHGPLGADTRRRHSNRQQGPRERWRSRELIRYKVSGPSRLRKADFFCLPFERDRVILRNYP